MSKIQIGYKIGRLTVLDFVGTVVKYGRERKIFSCKCECGKCIDLIGDALYVTKSCGCLRSYSAIKTMTTHGDCKKGNRAPEYNVFRTMINRCHNSNTEKYPIYGGRGISVCESWKNNYSEFLKDMGRRPSKNHSIDRIDVNGNYEPSNCRWATMTEQANNRTNSVFIEYKGEKLTITQWYVKSGYKKSLRTFRRKLNEQGYTLSDFINPS